MSDDHPRPPMLPLLTDEETRRLLAYFTILAEWEAAARDQEEAAKDGVTHPKGEGEPP